jgi:hypothetical protein
MPARDTYTGIMLDVNVSRLILKYCQGLPAHTVHIFRALVERQWKILVSDWWVLKHVQTNANGS